MDKNIRAESTGEEQTKEEIRLVEGKTKQRRDMF